MSEDEKETEKEDEVIEEELDEAQKEAKESYEKLLRVMAEFDNYKKRAAKEHEERVKYSHETLIRELLPALDDFDRILDHLPENPNREMKSFMEGAQLIHRQFLNVLKKFSLEEVPTQNQKFDPHWHEALTPVESKNHKPGEIVDCHRKGYKLHGRLIRAALVTVAKEAKNEENT